jgi:manganese efflux pump family protein
MLKLLAFVLPLGLDSFAVSAAIGTTQPVTARQRLRISVIFVAFKAGMPLIGLTLGSSLARIIGDVADYLAAAAVIGVGARMLTHGDGDDERAAGRILATRGTANIALGVSISLDELAIGISLGLARPPLVPVIRPKALPGLGVARPCGLVVGRSNAAVRAPPGRDRTQRPVLPGRPVANAKVPQSKAHLDTELLGRDHHTVHGCGAEWILGPRVTEQAIKIGKEDQSKRA